jgi:hypothetical protein
MIRQKLTVGLIASAFTLSLAPAWAGQRERPAGSESTGSAAPRDNGGGGSGGGSSSSAGGSSMGSSAPDPQPARAPRAEGADQRRGGGGSSSGRAVPRGAAGSGGSTSSSAGRDGNDRGNGQERAGGSTTARPRDGREPVGRAVDRRGPVPTGGGGVYYPGVIYDPYYSYYDPYYYGNRYSSYWSPYGYGYGLGYFAYDPFLSGGYGAGYGGYGPGAYGGYGGYDPYQGGGGYTGSSGYRGVGSIRLKVKPAEAQVYIDGYFVGQIDSFDGAFQRLSVEEGSHKVEVRAEGYTPVQFDVMVQPGETITYKGQLQKSH